MLVDGEERINQGLTLHLNNVVVHLLLTVCDNHTTTPYFFAPLLDLTLGSKGAVMAW